jgi:hypothetical protein
MRFSQSTWVPALFGGLAAVAVLWGTRHGSLVFPDTMSYLYAAQSLADRGDLQVQSPNGATLIVPRHWCTFHPAIPWRWLRFTGPAFQC